MGYISLLFTFISFYLCNYKSTNQLLKHKNVMVEQEYSVARFVLFQASSELSHM